MLKSLQQIHNQFLVLGLNQLVAEWYIKPSSILN